MLLEMDKRAVEEVSGGDDYTRQWGEWFGAAVSEMHEHPVGALFGVGGIIIAHYLSEH